MYLDYSLSDLEGMFLYDPDKGKVIKKNTGKEVGRVCGNALVYNVRIENRVITFNLPKLCYTMYHKVSLDKWDKVICVDGDILNLKIDNLSVARKVRHTEHEFRKPVVEVDRNIIFNPNNDQFVVRRGKYQAVYRCSSLKEAILIRNEWESDKTIHRWDKTVGKYKEYLG